MTEATNRITKDPDHVVIFDTTLRDGEQSPGASMTIDEKIRIATVLEEMGRRCDRGRFRHCLQGRFRVRARSRPADRQIRRLQPGPGRTRGYRAGGGEALEPARRKRIHTFIATSPLHMQYKLQMQPEEVLERIHDSVSHARRFTDDVEWSAEDGSRSDHDFLCRAVETAISAGASTINIPDTVGYAVPGEYAALIAMLIDRVPNSDQAVFSVHCHNDLGLAVANSLAAVGAGARQVECTIHGLGERPATRPWKRSSWLSRHGKTRCRTRPRFEAS